MASIENTGPIRSSRRWLKRVLWLVLLSPLLFFLLSNAWLSSPWGAGWVAGKVAQKIGLPAKIQRISWIPGGAVRIHGLEIQQAPVLQTHCPQALLSIETITVQPSWSQALRGQKDILSLTLERPQGCMTIEMMVDLLRRGQANIPTVEPSPTAQAQPPVVAVAPPNTPEATRPSPQAPATVAPPAATPPPSTITEKATTWLHIHDGSLILFHAGSGKALGEIHGINAAIPLAGKAAEGHIHLEKILCQEQATDAIDLKLSWQQPLLTIPEQAFQLWNWQGTWGAQIARLPGIPFSAGMVQKNQNWHSPQEKMHIGKLESLHRLNGLLVLPASWDAESLVQAQDIRVTWKGHESQFSRANSRCVLQRGILQCTDARAIGEDVSLLANGLFLADGRLSARARLVTPRRNVRALQDKIHGVFPEWHIALAPFPNEDNGAIDVLAGGDLFQPWISLDQGKNLLDLRKMISLWQQRQPRIQP